MNLQVAIGGAMLGSASALLLLTACSKRASEPLGATVSVPLAVDSGAGTCAARSVALRKLVGGCIAGPALCGKVLSVAFAANGAATDTRFVSEMAGHEQRTQAAVALDCVRGRFPAMGGSCSKSTTVAFKQSCTVH